MEDFEDKTDNNYKGKLVVMISMLINKDQVQDMSLFRKYLIYVPFSLVMFLTSLLMSLKFIIFLRWTKIPSVFLALSDVDKIFKDHLEI